MAMKYMMQKRAKKAADCMAEGGMVKEEEESGYLPLPDPKEAGEEGLVDRIMKRYAKGGEVGEPVADFEPNDFDVLDQEAPGAAADETGENSGDEIGDKEEDDDRRDIVSRIMKSRGKKDKMPRPA